MKHLTHKNYVVTNSKDKINKRKRKKKKEKKKKRKEKKGEF